MKIEVKSMEVRDLQSCLSDICFLGNGGSFMAYKAKTDNHEYIVWNYHFGGSLCQSGVKIAPILHLDDWLEIPITIELAEYPTLGDEKDNRRLVKALVREIENVIELEEWNVSELALAQFMES